MDTSPQDAAPPEASTDTGELTTPWNPASIRAEETPREFSRLFAAIERRIGWTVPGMRSDAVASANSGGYVIGVTSSVSGEGKTTIAMHLALKAAADTYKTVCLIDLSLGDDDLCERLGADFNGVGIVPLLESHPTGRQRPHVVRCGDLALIPAGKRPDNPARIARSPRVGELIDTARRMFELVIVDLPDFSSDNLLPLAIYVDGIVLVAQAGVTPRRVVARAVDCIGRDRVLGVVLNRVKFAGPDWLLQFVQRR